MTRPTATGSLPIIETPHLVGSLHTVRPVMQEARRQAIYGPVQSLRADARAIGEPPLRWGLALMITLAVLAPFCAAVF